MKIIVNKFDYDAIVRNCAKARDGYAGCGECVFDGLCGGPKKLEESCVLEDPETTADDDFSIL